MDELSVFTCGLRTSAQQEAGEPTHHQPFLPNIYITHRTKTNFRFGFGFKTSLDYTPYKKFGRGFKKSLDSAGKQGCNKFGLYFKTILDYTSKKVWSLLRNKFGLYFKKDWPYSSNQFCTILRIKFGLYFKTSLDYSS